MSLWLDVHILFETIKAVVVGHGIGASPVTAPIATTESPAAQERLEAA